MSLIILFLATHPDGGWVLATFWLKLEIVAAGVALAGLFAQGLPLLHTT